MILYGFHLILYGFHLVSIWFQSDFNMGVVGKSGQTLNFRPNFKNPENVNIQKKTGHSKKSWVAGNSSQPLKIQPNDKNPEKLSDIQQKRDI